MGLCINFKKKKNFKKLTIFGNTVFNFLAESLINNIVTRTKKMKLPSAAS